jgi:hypothetical protein
MLRLGKWKNSSDRTSEVVIGRRESGVFTVTRLPNGQVVRRLDDEVYERALNAARAALRQSKLPGGTPDDGISGTFKAKHR